MPAVDDHAAVDGDDVPVGEHGLPRYAVDDHVVGRCADHRRIAVVAEEVRRGAAAGSTSRPKSDRDPQSTPRPDRFADALVHLRDHPSGPAHRGELVSRAHRDRLGEEHQSGDPPSITAISRADTSSVAPTRPPRPAATASRSTLARAARSPAGRGRAGAGSPPRCRRRAGRRRPAVVAVPRVLRRLLDRVDAPQSMHWRRLAMRSMTTSTGTSRLITTCSGRSPAMRARASAWGTVRGSRRARSPGGSCPSGGAARRPHRS